MRLRVLIAAVLLSSSAMAEDAPTSWMLMMRANGNVAFAPTTYESEIECRLVVGSLKWVYEVACVPAHYPASAVKAFEEQRAATDQEEKNDATAARARLADLEKQRPALEAERRAIVDDRNKLNQQRYAERVLEIDALLRELDN